MSSIVELRFRLLNWPVYFQKKKKFFINYFYYFSSFFLKKKKIMLLTCHISAEGKSCTEFYINVLIYCCVCENWSFWDTVLLRIREHSSAGGYSLKNILTKPVIACCSVTGFWVLGDGDGREFEILWQKASNSWRIHCFACQKGYSLGVRNRPPLGRGFIICFTVVSMGNC